MIFFPPLSARRLLRSLSSYMTAGTSTIMIDACVWSLCSPAFVDGTCVCVCVCVCVRERERERERESQRQRQRDRRTETDLGSISLENSKGFQNQGGAFLKNMLASTSLKAPGQDLFIKLSQQFQKCCLSRPLPYHEPL